MFAEANRWPSLGSKWSHLWNAWLKCCSGLFPNHVRHAPKSKDVSPGLLSFWQWVKRGVISSWTKQRIPSLAEKHHLHQKSSCTRHHPEPDPDGPCSWIWRLWAWRLWAVVPGQFGHCDGQPPSWQLGSDPQQHQLWILCSYVSQDISQVQSQTIRVCMRSNCESRRVTKNCVFFPQTHWSSKKLEIPATGHFRWSEIGHRVIQGDLPTYVDIVFQTSRLRLLVLIAALMPCLLSIFAPNRLRSCTFLDGKFISVGIQHGGKQCDNSWSKLTRQTFGTLTSLRGTLNWSGFCRESNSYALLVCSARRPRLMVSLQNTRHFMCDDKMAFWRYNVWSWNFVFSQSASSVLHSIGRWTIVLLDGEFGKVEFFYAG